MRVWLVALILSLQAATGTTGALPSAASIDTAVHNVMTRTGARGVAVALIRDGRICYVQAYGVRNAKGDPLKMDTVMYGASLTKTVFAFTVLQLVDQGKLSLDTPLAVQILQIESAAPGARGT